MYMSLRQVTCQRQQALCTVCFQLIIIQLIIMTLETARLIAVLQVVSTDLPTAVLHSLQ